MGWQRQADRSKLSQAFAVNGQRPESNNYLLDGARNVNRMDGGFGIRTPIDAIQEFRILTHTAPAGVRVQQRRDRVSGHALGQQHAHGSVYYFGRNDAVDARNFFSADVEPLKQHQYGATFGGPLTTQQAVLLRILGRLPQSPGNYQDAQRCRPRRNGRGISRVCRIRAPEIG